MQSLNSNFQTLKELANAYPQINFYYLTSKSDLQQEITKLEANLYLIQEVNPKDLDIKAIRKIFKIKSFQKIYSLVFSTFWLARSVSHYRALKSFVKSKNQLAFIIESEALQQANFNDKFSQIAASLPADKELILTQGSDFISHQQEKELARTEEEQESTYNRANDDFRTLSLASYFIQQSLAKRITKAKRIKTLVNDFFYFTTPDKIARVKKSLYLTDSSSFYLKEVGGNVLEQENRSKLTNPHFLTYRYALSYREQRKVTIIEVIKEFLSQKLFQLLG